MAKRWKPKKGNKYWHLSNSGGNWQVEIQDEKPVWSIWDDNWIDRLRWKIGNCFKTRKEAQRKRKQLLKVLEER